MRISLDTFAKEARKQEANEEEIIYDQFESNLRLRAIDLGRNKIVLQEKRTEQK